MARLQFILPLLLAAHCVASAAQDTQVVAKPAVAVGDHWIYRTLNTRASYPKLVLMLTRVSYVKEDAIAVVDTLLHVEGADSPAAKARVGRRPGESAGESIFTAEWNYVADSSGAVYSPNSGHLRFPLQVGKSYAANSELRRPRLGAKVGWRYTRNVQVVGWEDVTVPAGTFRALKIDVTGQYVRLHDGRPGSDRWVFWYVPETKRWAKSFYEDADGSTTTELVEFEVH